jgi:hypothetical protein
MHDEHAATIARLTRERDEARAERERFLTACYGLARSARRFWLAVERGQYDARSIVGDEALNMRDTLADAGLCSTEGFVILMPGRDTTTEVTRDAQ